MGKPVGGLTGGGGILINNGASMGAVNLTQLTITHNDVSAAGNQLGAGSDNEGGTVTINRLLRSSTTPRHFAAAGFKIKGLDR